MSACECGLLNIRENYKNADVVFYGRVIQVMDKTMDGYDDAYLITRDGAYLNDGGFFPSIQIIKKYRGKRKFFKTGKIQIHQDWSLCDFFFKTGRYYLVFGFLDKNGILKTDVCTATKEFKVDNFEAQIGVYLN
jgi:hypothetical protein